MIGTGKWKGLVVLGLLCANTAYGQDASARDRELNAAYKFRQAGERDSAIAHFKRARQLDPADPRARLELSYLLGSEPGTRVSDLYALVLYQSRFSDVIINAIGRTGVVLEQSSELTGYLIGRVNRDTRSSGGTQPAIYSDNFALAGAGLRARPFHNPLTVYGEAGAAADLINNAGRDRFRGDARGGAYYADSWYDPAVKRAGSFVNDVYADVSYYSRYSNTIGYGLARPGIRLTDSKDGAVDLVARAFLAADSRKDFYNNIAETGVGLRFMSMPAVGFSAYAEYVRGTYLRGSGSYSHSYNDFRLSAILGKYTSSAPH